VIESDSSKEVWGAGLGNDDYYDDTRKAAVASFEIVTEILHRENLSMNNLVRQWNFIGDILGMKEGFQNYQVFNEVRSEFYSKFRTIAGFPAATGVGMKYGGVFLDFCALKTDDTVTMKAVSNPSQINAYEYSQQVLKGFAGSADSVKHPPQFERGLILINKTGSTLFVSGTASIIGQETIGKGDITEQTIVTIENIKKVADIERIKQLAEKQDMTDGKYSLLRVYIKKQEDFSSVKRICNKHFKDSPVIFIEADICRDDLLTEIEAEVTI
jgi:enamine deaminase RidA (YjgF/YER057c/UK114 family)